MENKDLVIDIILAEYSEIRTELMFFIAEQRKFISLMTTLVAAQAAFLVTNDDKISYEIITYLYLYFIPLAIFILMIRVLDATSRVLVLADYIRYGIKKQLHKVCGKHIVFFEWEKHKKETKIITRTTIDRLDGSKWYIFILGIIISFVLGLYFLNKANEADNLELILTHFIISATLNIFYSFFALKVENQFNESRGIEKEDY